MTRVAVAVGLVLMGGCGSGSGSEGELEADTARFRWGDQTVTVPLAECAQEGDVVILAGQRAGTLIQAAADVGEGGAERTGVTGEIAEDGIWGAFGSALDQGPAGEITRVEVEGDRLTVEGRWARLDDDLVAQPDTEVDGELVARCPDSADQS